MATRKKPVAEGEDSVFLVYGVVSDTVASQQVQKTALETKASTLTAFAGGMFALLMGARETLILFSAAGRILIIISVSLFALSVLLAAFVTWVRQYRADPDPEILAK